MKKHSFRNKTVKQLLSVLSGQKKSAQILLSNLNKGIFQKFANSNIAKLSPHVPVNYSDFHRDPNLPDLCPNHRDKISATRPMQAEEQFLR